MEVFWATVVILVAATGSIATVIRAMRLQEKELPLFEPFEIAHGGAEQSK